MAAGKEGTHPSSRSTRQPDQSRLSRLDDPQTAIQPASCSSSVSATHVLGPRPLCGYVQPLIARETRPTSCALELSSPLTGPDVLLSAVNAHHPHCQQHRPSSLSLEAQAHQELPPRMLAPARTPTFVWLLTSALALLASPCSSLARRPSHPSLARRVFASSDVISGLLSSNSGIDIPFNIPDCDGCQRAIDLADGCLTTQTGVDFDGERTRLRTPGRRS